MDTAPRPHLPTRILRWGIFLILGVRLAAATHTLVHLNDPNAWSGTLTVTGGGVRLVEEKANYAESDISPPHAIALYSIKDSAQITIDLSWGGGELLENSISVNGQPGMNYRATVKLDRDDAWALGTFSIEVKATLVIRNEDDEITDTYPFSTFFLMETRFYKELAVELTNTSGGFGRTLKTNAITPKVYTDPGTGYNQVILQKSAVGDVGVQVVAEGPIFVDKTDWERTGETGTLPLQLYASTDAAEFENGWVSGELLLRAVKSGCEVEYREPESLPFAIVDQALKSWYLGASGGLGQENNPAYPSMNLKQGDRIQVGTRLVSGYVSIEFCNGQKVYVQSSAYEGFIATVGNGTVIKGNPLLWVDLQNLAQDIKDTPRRCMRMAVYKGLGNAVDYLLGVPDPVGVITTSPGGAIEKLLVDFGERAYGPITAGPRSGSVRFVPMELSGSPGTNPTSTRAGQTTYTSAARATFDYYTDGSAWVENAGSPILLESESGAGARIAAGGAVFVAPLEVEAEVSAPATSNAAWAAPTPGTWTIEPADGSTITTDQPTVSFANSVPEAFVWETVSVRLDGVEITPLLTPRASAFNETVNALAGELPPAFLSNGTHTLSCAVTTFTGTLETATVDFTVALPSAPPPYVQAQAFDGGVWVTWDRVEGSTGYRIWRAATALETPVALNPGALRTEPGFLDPTPLATNVYWIESFDAEGTGSGPGDPCTADWSADLPIAPVPDAPGDPVLAETAEGIAVSFPHLHRDSNRWQLARGAAPEGPFTDLAPAEDTVDGFFLDTGTTPGEVVYYALTARALDGTAGSTVVAGPLTRSSLPEAPTGFTAHADGDDVVLQWDPVTDPRANALKLYQDSGDGFTLLQTLGAAATSVTLPGAAGTIGLYHLRAANLAGEEGTACLARGVGRHQRTSEAARVGFASTSLRFFESDGAATLPLVRSGNLAEPAVVRYLTTRGDGLAEPDVDYAERGGTVVFAPGQTEATLSIPILPDGLSEWPESFYVQLSTNTGANELVVEDAYAEVVIDESDLFLFANYQTSAMVSEGDAAAAVHIERIWPSRRMVSAQLILAEDPGTAVAGVDYTAFDAIDFTFGPGESIKAIPLPLLDDAVKDGSKTLRLQIANPAGGACVDETFYLIEVTIRDDEFKPGQVRLAQAEPVIVVGPAESSATVNLVREEGTEGSIDAWVMIDGGTVPWGAASLSPNSPSFADGQSTASLQVSINRSKLDASIGQFAVLSIANNEFPYETHEVLVVIAPADGGTSFADWAATRGLSGILSGPLEDRDGDGISNLAELATLRDATVADPSDTLALSPGERYLSIQCDVPPAPNLVIFAEFSEDLDWSAPSLSGGYWFWNAETGAYEVGFDHWGALDGNGTIFGRLRYLWLEP